MGYSEASSPVVYLAEECRSVSEGGMKGSPHREVPTFNLHTTSISTLYQSDSDDSSQWPSPDGTSAGPGRNVSLNTPDMFDTLSLHDGQAETKVSIQAYITHVENGIKTNDLLNRSLQEFCNIGFEYIDKLQALVDKMNLTFAGESSGAVTSIDALKSFIVKTVGNQRDFLDAVSHECIIPEQCSEAFAELKSDVERVRSDHAESEAARCALAASVEDLYLQSKTAVTMCSEACHETPLVKTRLHGALIPVFVKFMEKDREFKSLSSDKSQMKFDAETERLKTSLRRLDYERIIALRDCLSKFMVYETARIRNTQYDLTTLVNALNALDPNQEWSAFEAGGHLEVDISASDSLIHTTRHYARYLKNAIPEVFRNYAISRLTLSAPKERVLQRVERTLSKYVDAVWNDEPDSVAIKEFVGEMQSSLVRQVFCNMVTAYSLRANCLNSMAAMKLLSRMIGALLSFSQRQRDAWSGYAVLRVSDFIHAYNEISDEDGEARLPLRLFIHRHDYWSQIPFWEECLLIVIAQDLKVLFEESKGKGALCPVTKELRHFKEWMELFGIKRGEVQAMVTRVCGQMHLPEEYVRFLVDNSDI